MDIINAPYVLPTHCPVAMEIIVPPTIYCLMPRKKKATMKNMMALL